MKQVYILYSILFFVLGGYAYSQEIQPLFDYWKYYSDDSDALYDHFVETALIRLKERETVINQLKTKEAWESRKSAVREKLNEIIGPFPPKTPLNAKITGRLQADDFQVEKVVYESMPGFYVTAALFIPDNLKGKAPAILYCSGHTYESFRSKVYQHMIINLVKKGFIVLAFDPIGQGERLQYLNEAGDESIFRTPTYEHSYPGNQCFAAGSSLAKYMIWDGIRSLDYLVSRPEVDPSRIGITGRSGGGTQTTYIAAFDTRVKASAPECYITSFNYLMKSIGPQDAEQNFPGFLHHNLDLADFLEVRIPEPTMIISTTNDFFSIQGARETYWEAKRAYGIWGYEDRISMVEDDAPHQSTLKNRQALYYFFQKYLDLPSDTADLQVDLFTHQELQVTETGQALTSMGGETIFTLNQKESGLIFNALQTKREQEGIQKADLKNRIKAYTRFSTPNSSGQFIFSGREVFEDHYIEKYLIKGGGKYHIPLLVMIPHKGINGKAAIILHPDGKESETKEGTLGKWMLNEGFHVILPDMAGIGELGPSNPEIDEFIDHSMYKHWVAGIQAGKNQTGIRMQDLELICDFTENAFSFSKNSIYGIGKGILANDLLHAAVSLNNFNRIALIEPLVSFRSLILNRDYKPDLIQTLVPGAIRHYDLPDLAGSLAPGKLLMIDVADHQGNHLNNLKDHKDIKVIRQAYMKENADKQFEVKRSLNHSYDELFNHWLE